MSTTYEKLKDGLQKYPDLSVNGVAKKLNLAVAGSSYAKLRKDGLGHRISSVGAGPRTPAPARVKTPRPIGVKSKKHKVQTVSIQAPSQNKVVVFVGDSASVGEALRSMGAL